MPDVLLRTPLFSSSVSNPNQVGAGTAHHHLINNQLKIQHVKRHARAHLKTRCEAASNLTSAPATNTTPSVEWIQRTVNLPPYNRGCHIITQQIYKAVPEIKEFQVGIAHIFVMHTSASLTINENASPDVPLDMEDALNKIAPEGRHYRHLDEGLDDMPAHVKSSLMGCSLSVPITAGRFNLGLWQGIWLNEHRDYGGSRKICITLHGQR